MIDDVIGDLFGPTAGTIRIGPRSLSDGGWSAELHDPRARVRVVLPVKDSTRSATAATRGRELKGLGPPGPQGTFGNRSRAVAEGEST